MSLGGVRQRRTTQRSQWLELDEDLEIATVAPPYDGRPRNDNHSVLSSIKGPIWIGPFFVIIKKKLFLN
jgi:hypothetical protein